MYLYPDKDPSTLNDENLKREYDSVKAYLDTVDPANQEERQSYFKANPKEADKIIKVGEYKPKVKSNTDLAAMMQVMQVIYNMEEAITKT